MKKLYSWLVIRAFQIKEVESNESLEKKLLKEKRVHIIRRNAAAFFALAGILLLLVTFFMPGLKAHYKFSRIYNTASIMNTCSGCFTGISFLILIALVDAKKQQEITATANTNNKPEEG